MTRSHFGAVQYLGKDRYRVSVEAPRDANGKRHRRSKVVRGSRQDAENVLARMKLDAGKIERSDITVSGYWDVFYSPLLDSLAESTASGYRYAYEGHVQPLFGDCSMGSLHARDIEAKLATIESPGAQRNAFKLMRQMFNEAYRDELIDENPFMRRIRLKRMETYEPEILLLADVPAWAAAIRGSKWEPVLLCMLFGGLRREEAAALYWEDLSFADDICAIRIDKTLTTVRGKKVSGKTKTARSTRTVYIGGWPCARLRELAGAGPLCPDSSGDRADPDRISHEYRDLMKKSPDAKYVPMKNLRNSYATIMQGLGASDSLISKSLGHTELQTDYAHYFAANAPAHMDNARMLGSAVENACNIV